MIDRPNPSLIYNLSKEAANNLRKSHFTLGDNKTDYKTQSGFSHIAYTLAADGKANRAELKTKMQTAQFNLGTASAKAANNQTTYAKEIDDRVKGGS